MIDSHCHLADKQFAEDCDAVIRRAVAAGVTWMVTIADSLEESETCIALSKKYDQIFCSVGVHPHHAAAWRNPKHQMPNSKSAAEVLERLARLSQKVVAIGEIGLDYHYNFSPPDVQKAAFREQLELAKELRMPTVVHCRNAIDDVWAIVDAARLERLVLHCCTEKWEEVRKFVDRGYLLSFTGIATYPQSEEVRRTIRMCPLEQMMVETDAPYLAPVPFRGKRNEPAYVIEVAKGVAEVKGIPPEEADRATTGNAVRFFGLPNGVDNSCK